ncbi:MAG TPA: hypothetical protein QGG18_00945 [Rhodospirillales bacterium]|nr:hypothetical protein [Rhodospirillales bacterium]|tara:strand:- start:370 stop:492 length:123 start_codon:yes stop_codon:yes gene_type:complete
MGIRKGANQTFMEELGDFGIQPLFFDAAGYDVAAIKVSNV